MINYSALLKTWNLEFNNICDNIQLFGSPERSCFRTAVETMDGTVLILENIDQKQLGNKKRIANLLQTLKDIDPQLPIYPYLLNQNQQFHTQHQDRYWQIMPYVVGLPLDRRNYLDEAWRAEPMADFLINVHQIVTQTNLAAAKNQPNFSLQEFVQKMDLTLAKHNPVEHQQLKNIFNYLETNLWPLYHQLPNTFCHGDFHPLNIIWSSNGINAVIDWEFSGHKVETYDLANLVGCLGMEHPRVLSQDLVIKLLSYMKESQIISPISWTHFIDILLAQRFAWLSEWLRNNDSAMVKLEITYLNLILDRKQVLLKSWEI